MAHGLICASSLRELAHNWRNLQAGKQAKAPRCRKWRKTAVQSKSRTVAELAQDWRKLAQRRAFAPVVETPPKGGALTTSGAGPKPVAELAQRAIRADWADFSMTPGGRDEDAKKLGRLSASGTVAAAVRRWLRRSLAGWKRTSARLERKARS